MLPHHRHPLRMRQDTGQSCLRRFPQTAVAHTANATVERCHASGSLQRGHPTRAIHPRCPHVRTHARAARPAGSRITRHELCSRRLATVSPSSSTLASPRSVSTRIFRIHYGLKDMGRTLGRAEVTPYSYVRVRLRTSWSHPGT
ncbi:hypothetical protein V8D89_015517 [Ganoderma adspersum]